jgi:hypothetical protein
MIISDLETALFHNLCVNLRDLLVRHTQGMPPRNPLISLILRKIARFQIGNRIFQVNFLWVDRGSCRSICFS